MRTKSGRLLALLLTVAMVLSLLPAAVFAEEPAQTVWSQIAFSDITAGDTVAITMTSGTETYVLPTVGNGSSEQPVAELATVSGTALTTSGNAAAHGWSISEAEGGHYIKSGESYLYITPTNNGVRIGDTSCVWSLIEDGYLSAVDSQGDTRYLGVYVKGLDWRCYKAYATGNIAGQSVKFWVLDPDGTPSAPIEPEDPDVPDVPEVPEEPEVPVVPDGTVLAQLTNEISDGSKVYIYNPKNAKVLTAEPSGNMLASADGVVEDGQLVVTEDMAELTVSVDADGYYSFQNASGEYLTCGTAANILTFEAAASEYSLWTVEAKTDAEGAIEGFFVKSVNGTNNGSQMALEYYKENYTVYSFQSYNTGAFMLQFFTTGSGGFTDTIAAGDQVLIYNPTNSVALSNVILDTEKNQDLAGTSLVLSNDDKLSGYTEADVWTVSVTDDGKYVFSTADGQKLAVSNRTHLGFGEEYNTWTLVKVDGKEDEYYVSSGMGTYLEWYADKQYWSAYYNPSEALYAVRFYLVSGTAQPSNTVATPKASPKSGEVDSGTEISFTCATEGAVIYYHTGDGEWTEFTAPIAITEDTNFTVKAVKEGMEDSKEVTFKYTIYVPPVLGELQAQLVTDASQLSSGDKIIIVTKDYNFALGVTQKANNRDPSNIIKAYDKVSYDEFTQIITLESGVKEGTYALYATNGDCTGYLYASPESGNLLRTQEGKDINASFTIAINSDGSADIVSQIESKTANTIRYNTTGLFSCYKFGGQKPVCIYKLDGQEKPGLPEEGATVVIFNQAAKGVLSGMDGDLSDVYGCAVRRAGATIVENEAVCSNGALLFAVEKNGEYYRFYNESFGYLCSTGTGNNTFYTKEASEDADWLVEEYNGGYRMGSRTAAFEGNIQYLQYYSDSFTTWGMYDVTDRDVFTYNFYPCANTLITEGVVNEPQAVFGNLAAAYAGQKYILHFTVDALFGVKELKVCLGETELEYALSAGRYTATIPAEMIVGEKLIVTVTGLDNKDVPIHSVVEIEVKDEPVISTVSPAANSQTKENKRPEISAVLTNVGNDPTIVMTVNGAEVETVYENGKVSYTPASDMADGRVSVTVTVTRADGKTVSKSWSFTVGESNFTLAFGQLHSHNGEYSDGSGTLAGALEYIEGLPESANVDFVAFTDHSNYFDKSGEANPEDALFDLSLATPYAQERWSTYKNTIAEFNNTHSNVIAIAGFEMTWSGGPGHMNTFVTDGIVSRNNTTLNNKSADAGMQAYYALLAREEGADSITQFNHPGTTFGNFTDFSYWNPAADSRVQLVEVGNGEGQVGGSGYYPSYEQYTLALDKGWHVAPTNNQDNHKGKWGNANDARDVVLVEEFSEEGIYEAIRNYRAYSTEDKNLEIFYQVNELPMGTIIEDVPAVLNFDISIMDPDTTDSFAKVELIVNSGKVAYTWDDPEVLAGGILKAELTPDYSYYYVRVTQADGNLAVTAPVWVGESLKLGITAVESSTTTPVTGEELTITTTLYNEESSDALIKSIVYTTNGSEVLGVDNDIHILAAGSTLALDWAYTPAEAKLTTITATVVVELEGKEYTFSTSIELDVQDAAQITYIGIDASHKNEYVAGYNKDLVNNFITLASGSAIRTEILSSSEALIAACENKDGKFSAIVLNVPSRRLPEVKDYSEAELDAIASFNANGGVLIITGSGDSNDQKADAVHMAAAQNAVLEALGSSLRLSDDGTYEGTSYSLELNTYGENALTENLDSGVISYYGGSSIYVVDEEGNATSAIPDTVSPVLFGNSATYSKDADNDGLGGESTVKYACAEGDERLMVMAMEQLAGKGMIFVAGAAFMNDYDLKIPAENANNTLCENLLNLVNPTKITPISEVRAQSEEGFKYTIEGVVTSNASGYDKETAFFDCIYVQDATGGINCFPVAGEFKIGDVVRISGTTDSYQGEPELQVLTIEVIGSADPVDPIVITSAQLNDRSVEGMLVTLKGYVTDITRANGLVESIYVRDEKGDVGRVFIDGYITAAKTIENLEVGSYVEATGIASYDDTYAIEHDSYARIRVRDRAEIVAELHEHTVEILPAVAPTCTESGLTEGSICSVCGEVIVAQEVIAATGHDYSDGFCVNCGEADPDKPDVEYVDVSADAWYYDAVQYVSRNGLMNGVGENVFDPEGAMTRAMVVTVLWRYAGSPAEGENIFDDVAEGEWYTEAVAWAAHNEVVNGVGEGKFDPNGLVTREQLATILYRYTVAQNVDVSTSADLSSYADASDVSDYAAEAMSWAVAAGLINGLVIDDANCLDPQGSATRAQVATILMRYVESMK